MQAEHLAADDRAERAAHPPREVQPLLPGEPGAAAATAACRVNTPVPVTRPTWRTPMARPGPPPGDLHLVGQAERPDPGVAVEGGADARVARRGEPDGDRVVHPVDVRPDVLDDPPHLGRRGVDHRADPDGAHRRMLRTGGARPTDRADRPSSRRSAELLAAGRPALADVGRAVRDVVRAGRVGRDHEVVRTEGGDDVFGVDDRADRVLLAGLAPARRALAGHGRARGLRRPGAGRSVGEPAARPVALPRRPGRRHPALPRRQAQRLGAARRRSPGDHPRGARGRRRRRDPDARGPRSAWWRGRPRPERWPARVDDDLVGGGRADAGRAAARRPAGRSTAASSPSCGCCPAATARSGPWADRHLAGLEVYDDLVPCTGGAMMGLASGADRAVFDPRPLLHPGELRRPPLRPGRPGRGPGRRRRHRGPAARARSTSRSTPAPPWPGPATPTRPPPSASAPPTSDSPVVPAVGATAESRAGRAELRRRRPRGRRC